jgi:hypothetical protein
MKRVGRLDTSTAALAVIPLATFSLAGDDVIAEYHDAPYRESMERHGIQTMQTGRAVRPSDGRVFYDALETAYSNSSRVVITVD